MEGIKILIIIFSILFLLETKPMNILFNFIGIIISVAILIGYHHADYLSYLLIIVYCSALTIIFGFVLMLNKPTQPIPKVPYITYAFITVGLFLYFMVQGLNAVPDNTNNVIYINKIGELLYLDINNIIKLFISTLILLLALVALFFLLGKRANSKNV